MSEFTKGKWVYDEPFGVIFSNETYAVIANVQGAGTGSCFCFTQEGQANARLIAAAPDMYQLLTGILSGYAFELAKNGVFRLSDEFRSNLLLLMKHIEGDDD